MNPGGAPRAWAAAVLAAGLVLSGLAAHFQQHTNQLAAQTQFDAESARAVAAVVERLHLYEFGLRSVRGAVLAGGVSMTASLNPCWRKIARSEARRDTVVCANAGKSASRSFHQSAREPCGSISIKTTGPAPANCACTAR